MESRTNHSLILKDCTVLGASGFPFSPGDTIALVFKHNVVRCSGRSYLAELSLLELAELSVSGPGTLVTGGGFIGGGLGVEGALEGIAIANVLNALTTKKKTHTFVTLTANFGELHLHYGSMDPGAVRVFLSDVFVRLRNMNSQWRQSREQLIDDQLAKGSISGTEADTLKSRLASQPIWTDLASEAKAQRLLGESAEGPKGTCPSCDHTISLHSEHCQYCRANFGRYSSWSVIPIVQ
ncbi:MAG TPA: hypothetical protein VL001_06035 [Candidimonas sp.]|nr:hypothetical protein [Candidimonas sp.]